MKIDTLTKIGLCFSAVIGGGLFFIMGSTPDCSQATIHKQECDLLTHVLTQGGLISMISGICGRILIRIWKQDTDKPKGNQNDFRSPIRPNGKEDSQ